MEEFEGKVIRYIDSEVGHNLDAYVVGCEFDIGITVVKYKNKHHYLYCLKGPSAVPELYKDDNMRYERYNEKFENIIAMFKEGFLDMDIVGEINRKYNRRILGGVGPHTCAFNK